MLQRLQPMAMHTLLLLYGPGDSLDHAVLLWAMRRNKFLLLFMASDQRDIAATGEDYAAIGAKQERCRHPSQCSVAGDQRLFHRRFAVMALPERDSFRLRTARLESKSGVVYGGRMEWKKRSHAHCSEHGTDARDFLRLSAYGYSIGLPLDIHAVKSASAFIY